MDVRLTRKEDTLPGPGFAINDETNKWDDFDNDRVFAAEPRCAIRRDRERSLAAPDSAIVFNGVFKKGVTGWSGTVPHFYTSRGSDLRIIEGLESERQQRWDGPPVLALEAIECIALGCSGRGLDGPHAAADLLLR